MAQKLRKLLLYQKPEFGFQQSHPGTILLEPTLLASVAVLTHVHIRTYKHIHTYT